MMRGTFVRNISPIAAQAWIDALIAEGWETVPGWDFKPNGLRGRGRRGWYRRADGSREMTVMPHGLRASLYIGPVRP